MSAVVVSPAASAAALRALDAFADLHVVVLGDAILDAYLEAGTTRLAREAPVPNVSISQRRLRAGGAANTAVNAAALGAQVRFIGVVGNDGDGRELAQVLHTADVDVTRCVIAETRLTRAKVRVVAGHQLLLSYDSGQTQPVDDAIEDALIAALRLAISDADVLIVADYGYGTVTERLLDALADELRVHRPPVVAVDSRHRLQAFASLRPDLVKPNAEEIAELMHWPEFASLQRHRVQRVQAHAIDILAATGARHAVATLDSEGSVLLRAGQLPMHRAAARGTHAAAAGAGDCFIAAMALALATGAAPEVAHAIAQRAADLVVAKDGTARCTLAELQAALVPPAKLLADVQALSQLAAGTRRRGARLVFTNGCFDLLHRGHVALLEQARALGDVLVVGVNSDASARRLKGKNRPINRLEDRLQVLAALACVDYVIAFDEDSAHALVKHARPQVFVKGGNWREACVPEAALVREFGGEVRVLPTLWSDSTSSLLQRIAERTRAGAEGVPLAGGGRSGVGT
jgi:D-beta-D-heptose 7-phosphate kinase/D-beta-D-heptose 1-phosphate adenosyltransferase